MTGASRGIGAAIAAALHRQGATIVGTYHTATDEASRLQASMDRLTMIAVDLGDRAATRRFLEDVKRSGRLSGIVNNAGLIGFEDYDEFSMDLWDRTLEVNVSAVALICHELRNQIDPGGSIVNIASTDAFIGSFSNIAYSASKAALVSLTKSLANVLGHASIRVNCVAPGWIETDMANEEWNEAAAYTPLGRNGTPDDIAQVVCCLLSDSAAFITGSTIVADGGYAGVDHIMKRHYAEAD